VVAQLANVAPELAEAVAAGLGIEMPPPLPQATPKVASPEVTSSPALSLTSRPGEASVAARRIALLVADGVDAATLVELHAKFAVAGAVPRFVGASMGSVSSTDGASIPVEVTMEAAPSVLWDALVLPGGGAVDTLMAQGYALDFLRDQYRHSKPILVLTGAEALLKKLGIPKALPTGEVDPGLVYGDAGDLGGTIDAFCAAVGRHRFFARETDPPLV
jgi:catalase